MKIKHIFTAGVILSILGLYGCTDNFEHLNTNPHSSPSLAPGVQFATLMLDLSGNREEVWRYDLGIASPKVQHLGGSWWTQHGGQYRVVERTHWNSLWENSYTREVKNIIDLLERTREADEYHNTHQAARIMKVYIFSRLTDLYGDIPYSEAGRGFYEQIFQPKYDRQQDIYADFFVELDEAVAALDNSRPGVEGDLFYSGDVERWRKFGNSLRMRLGFRIIKVDEAESQRQVQAAIAGGVMESNDDIALMQHSNFSYQDGAENRGNGRSQVFHASADSEGFRLVSTLVDFMHETEDPRLTRYGGTYLGVNAGEYGQDVTEYLQLGLTPGGMWWSLWADHGDLFDDEGNYVAWVGQTHKHMMPSRYVAAYDAPFFHFTYAESELYLAEAIVRGWHSGDAGFHFHNAVRASSGHVSMYPGAPEITEDEITGFIAANPFPAGTEDQIRVINEQHWVNFFLNGVEAYSNYRRSGYPELQPFEALEGDVSETGGQIPRRFFYPQFEAVNNPDNYQDAISRIGGSNDWLQPVWWDVQ